MSPGPVHKYTGLRVALIALGALFCVAAVSFTFVWRFDDNQVYSQQAGEAAKDDIVSPKALTYVSQVQSDKAQDEAAKNSANIVYQRDETAVVKQRSALNDLLGIIGSARSNRLSSETVVGDLLQQNQVKAANLDSESLTAFLNLPGNQWIDVSNEARNILGMMSSTEIRPQILSGEINRLKNSVYNPWNYSPTFIKLDEASRTLVVKLVQPFVAQNSFIDEKATKLKQDEARKAADPVSVSVVKGQSVVRRGEILSTLQIEQLQQLGLRSAGTNLPTVSGTVGIVAALILLIIYYFTLLHRSIWGNPRMLLFIGFSLIVAAAGMRLLVVNSAEHAIRPYILPLAAISMVLAALLDVNLALFFTAVLAFLAGYVAHSPENAAVFFVGGAAGAFTLYKADRTLTFVYAGLMVAAGQFVVSLFFNLASGSLSTPLAGLLLLTNLLNGLVSTSLAFFIFSALGKIFGVTTVIQLLELAHPNQPLLRRLMREAPGTYHHSILVSNLAEQAAEKLMGDALLARVGAYYHDIGKLSRPGHFIDNQGGGANIHDQLDPRESARIIKAHVEDGVKLAHKNHLPRKVVDIIHQHHGTCLISFFYSKALEQGLDVSEIDFRYSGPKPQTKVAAIVMLSDGVEAAVRANIQSGRIPTGSKPAVPAALGSLTHDHKKTVTIQQVVNKIIDDRINDGQLNECDLTLKDIEELRHLFVEILAGIYHPRIDYPDQSIKIAKLEATIPVSHNPGSEQNIPETLPELEAALPALREIVPLSPTINETGAADSGEITASKALTKNRSHFG